MTAPVDILREALLAANEDVYGDEGNKAALAALEQLREGLEACRELFIDLRGDWSDNRGPCREGLAIIASILGTEEK